MSVKATRIFDARLGNSGTGKNTLLSILARIGCLCWLLLTGFEAQATEPSERQRWTLREVETDTSDLPDSPFPVPPGVLLLETSLTRERGNGAHRRLSTETLLRFGISRGWELRVSSDGWVWERSHDGRRTGVGDVVLGFKRHLFPERGIRPAMGVIVQTKLPIAFSNLSSSALEPTVFFNFGKSLPSGFDVEVNFGVSWSKSGSGRRFVQYHLLWGVEKELGRGIGVFVHSAADFPAEPKAGNSVLLGPGFTWLINERTQLDMSLTFGLTKAAPNNVFRVGLAILW